jgi:hypothetical protein
MNKYLIVGIDKYYENSLPTTIGAVNSARKWKTILDERNFKGEILLNSEAEDLIIINKLNLLIENLSEGEIGTFIYIGHGGKMNINSLDKIESGDDEVLYPYIGHIKDDELRSILDKKNKNVIFLTILDCCDNGVVENLLIDDISKNEITISASINKQLMQLDKIDLERHAVFSYFAQKVIMNNSDVNFGELIFFVNEELKNSKYNQESQIIVSNISLFDFKFFNIQENKNQLLQNDKISKSNTASNLEDYIKNSPNYRIGNIQKEVNPLFYEFSTDISSKFNGKTLSQIKFILNPLNKKL